MSIPALFQKGRVLSLEVFPPKPDAPIEVIDGTLNLLAPIKPDYISVTYGAGGSGRSRSVEIAKKILPICDCLSHLTCVGADAQEIDNVLDSLTAAGVENIMALRGDVPKDMDRESAYGAETLDRMPSVIPFTIPGCCPDGRGLWHGRLGIEPTTRGFGDRVATLGHSPVYGPEPYLRGRNSLKDRGRDALSPVPGI